MFASAVGNGPVLTSVHRLERPNGYLNFSPICVHWHCPYSQQMDSCANYIVHFASENSVISQLAHVAIHLLRDVSTNCSADNCTAIGMN